MEQLDASGDLHGRVLDFISDQDRHFFAEHPTETEYWRDPMEHELCDPHYYPACVPAPLPEGEVVIRVMKVNEEIRLRQALVYQILSES